MPQFIRNGPAVPDKLVQDLEDDRVVIFCGAGVSMGAGLPSYNGLVADCYKALSHPAPIDEKEWMWPDRLLGSLESRFTPDRVRQVVTTRLGRRPKSLDMHRAILRLSRLRRSNGMRLVTTNFDTYFERARRGLNFGLDFHYHSGPILPIPRDDLAASWRSLVYLHGRLGGPSQHLVLTSADFGRAYLTEGWAARFIVKLFADFTVLFLGYSLNDPVLRYMTDAFAAENLELRLGQPRGPAYIFTSYDAPEPPDSQPYRDRNLEPIFYAAPHNDHSILRDTIVEWADWRDDYLSSVGRLIGDIAPRRPDSIDPTDTANLVWAVAGRGGDRGFGGRTFAAVEPLPPFAWMQEFDAHDARRTAEHDRLSSVAQDTGRPSPPPLGLNFDPLFPVQSDHRGIGLSQTGSAAIAWMCRHLESEEFVEYVIEKMDQGRMLHPRLRQAIRRRLIETPPVRAGFAKFWWIVSADGRWVGGRRHTMPGALWNVQGTYAHGVDREWVRQELLAGLKPMLDFSASGHRAYHEALYPDQAESAIGDRMSQIADAEVVLADAHHVRGVIDTINARPSAGAFWCDMLDDLTSLLSQALHLFAMADKASVDGDPSTLQRPSVEPHAQNHNHREWTRFFDLIWVGWTHLDSTEPDRSRAMVARWRSLPFLSFRRLVAAAMVRSPNFSPEEKAEVLLNG